MTADLYPFQDAAVDELLYELKFARQKVKDLSKPQTLLLSAPTGSGKTVIMAALIEAVLGGHPSGDHSDSFPDKDASLLWITDQPELNEQTIDRMKAHMDIERCGSIEDVSNYFDQEELSPKTLYFVNTQKLGKKGLLVRSGDNRANTFWETMRNTIEERPSSVYVIIDEAHRGMKEAKGRRGSSDPVEEVNTIIQRFIKGFVDDEGTMMPAAPLIIGVSATPKRFKRVLEECGRPENTTSVPPGEVRDSGLLKESIRLWHARTPADNDMTLLRQAVRRFIRYEQAWADYCEKPNGSDADNSLVRPIMLIQVEDVSDAARKRGLHSDTPLGDVYGIVSEELERAGSLKANAFAHSFEDKKPIKIGSNQIRRLAPAEIDDDQNVRVVFFKTALNTGWDCPRAEVMMSFRTAKDATSIAQLVGRMVRAPLRKHIEGDVSDLLNSVDLFLPKYDEDALNIVVKYLTDDNEETRVTSPVQTQLVDLQLNPKIGGASECREILGSLATYEPLQKRRMSPITRLMAVAAALQRKGGLEPVLQDATEIASKVMVEWMLNRFEQLAAQPDSPLSQALVEVEQVRVQGSEIDTSELIGASEEDIGVTALAEDGVVEKVSDQDLRRGIARADRELGEGLAEEYVEARSAHLSGDDNYRQARLELLALMIADRELVESLGRVADETIEEWLRIHAEKILQISDAERKALDELTAPEGSARQKPLPQPVPERITRPEEKSADTWDNHLYANDNGLITAKLNDWERDILKEELSRGDVVAWLRNRRGDIWSLAIPYTAGSETHLMYPDFLIFRRQKDRLVVDILDPHGLHLADAVCKAKGLAEYAKRHAGKASENLVMRVEAIAEVDGNMRRLNMADDEIWKLLDRVDSHWKLEALFDGETSIGEPLKTIQTYVEPDQSRDTGDRIRGALS